MSIFVPWRMVFCLILELAIEEGGEVGKVRRRGRVEGDGECSIGPKGQKGALQMRVGGLSR